MTTINKGQGHMTEGLPRVTMTTINKGQGHMTPGYLGNHACHQQRLGSYATKVLWDLQHKTLHPD